MPHFDCNFFCRTGYWWLLSVCFVMLTNHQSTVWALENNPALLTMTTSSAGLNSTSQIPPTEAKDRSSVKIDSDCNDQIWLVSTRQLINPSRNSIELPKFSLQRYEAPSTWQNSSLDDFIESEDPNTVTIVWVHGNRVDSGAAKQRGMAFYRNLAANSQHDRPVRMVIWSWPSSRIRGHLEDVRVKAQRTNLQALYLAQFLVQLPEDHQVSLTGFSLGGRIVTGALHLVAGGTLSGWQLSPGAETSGNFRVVLYAPALHNDWLLPGKPHQLAMSMVDGAILMNNDCDPILKRYRFITKCGNPEALGYAGLARIHKLGETKERVQQWNVCRLVGRTHDLLSYLCNGSIMNRTRRYVLWDPLDI
mgnify:FL=1